MAETEIPQLCFIPNKSTFLSIIKAFLFPIEFSRFPLASAPIGVEGIALVCDIADNFI